MTKTFASVIDACRSSILQRALLLQSMYVGRYVTKVDRVHTTCRRVMKFSNRVGVHVRNEVPRNFPEIWRGWELWGSSALKRQKNVKIGYNWRQTTSFSGNDPIFTEIEIAEFSGDVETYTGSGITADKQFRGHSGGRGSKKTITSDINV
jgi:hypothetical protein